jgi:CDP-diacylglycerol--glycerol-3-phosphate 3-phosphatidyltransferase
MATATSPGRQTVWNLPNQLTASRFVLALILFVLIEWEVWLGCLLIFVAAAVTDWLDGYLARKQGLTSSLGRNLDPLVDKVLVCGAYIFLLPDGDREGWLKAWMVTLVVARELVITGLRGWMESQGATFGADWLGKIKMGLQCAALIAIFFTQGARDWELYPALKILRAGLVWAMLLATLLSGLQYLWKAFALLRPASENGATAEIQS